MIKTFNTTLLAICALVAVPAFAALPDNFAKHWANSVTLTEAVADAMPADGYNFIPSSTVEPKEMSFAELMVHIVLADVSAFSRVSGAKGPAKPSSMDKASVSAFMKEGFDFCNKQLDAMTDDQKSKMIGPEGKQMSGGEILWAYFTHTAHHRGQAEVYLRLKGVKPPTYTF